MSLLLPPVPCSFYDPAPSHPAPPLSIPTHGVVVSTKNLDHRQRTSAPANPPDAAADR